MRLLIKLIVFFIIVAFWPITVPILIILALMKRGMKADFEP